MLTDVKCASSRDIASSAKPCCTPSGPRRVTAKYRPTRGSTGRLSEPKVTKRPNFFSSLMRLESRIFREAFVVRDGGLLNGGVADAMQTHLPTGARCRVHHVLQFRIGEPALATEARLAFVIRERPGGRSSEAAIHCILADGSQPDLGVTVARMMRVLLQTLRAGLRDVGGDARNVVLRCDLLEALEREVRPRVHSRPPREFCRPSPPPPT